MSKNVAVFVDVANIFYAAKSAGVDIDYVTLLKSASAGRDLVRAYAYTGLDPDNENQRNFHSFLARNGYRVVSKDIRKYGDGKVKANLDIELVVDMMKTARNLDIAIVVSGDGDFAPAIRAVQEQGVRVEVISFRGNTSSDLIDVADQFTDIIQLAKVEKGSSRSGRRVADAEEDLSMTEVPDKQTEGTGAGRGRGGRGRFGRGRVGEAEPVAARRAPAAVTPVAPAAAAVAVTSSGAPLVVLPGEKLSRVTPVAPAELPGDDEEMDVEEAPEGLDAIASQDGGVDGVDGDPEARRRRRRRGGRGRGRGRGEGEAREVREPREIAPVAEADAEDDEEEEFDAPQLPAARTNTFGSVWDSQLGVANRLPSGTQPVAPVGDDDDFEEPEIPEYLIAERRNRGRGAGGPGGQGPRGGRGARGGYAAAIERERYGRGGGGGINRYPDVSARERAPERAREDRGPRPAGRPAAGMPPRPAPRPAGGGDPWSEVPPELEAMLRAQLGSRGGGTRRPERPGRDVPDAVPTTEEPEVTPVSVSEDLEAATSATNGTEPNGALEAFEARDAADALEAMTAAGGPVATPDPVPAAPPRRRGRRPAAEAAEAAATGTDGASDGATAGDATAAEVATDATPKRRTTRRRATPDAAASGSAIDEAGSATPDGAGTAADADAAPRRRTTRRKAAEAGETPAPDRSSEATAGGDEPVAPKRRTTRRKAADTEAPATAGVEGETAPARPRRTRRTASSEETPAG